MIKSRIEKQTRRINDFKRWIVIDDTYQGSFSLSTKKEAETFVQDRTRVIPPDLKLRGRWHRDHMFGNLWFATAIIKPTDGGFYPVIDGLGGQVFKTEEEAAYQAERAIAYNALRVLQELEPELLTLTAETTV